LGRSRIAAIRAYRLGHSPLNDRISYAGPNCPEMGRTQHFDRDGFNGRVRRVSPVAARSGDGLLSEPIAGARPGHRELVFMPQMDHSTPDVELPGRWESDFERSGQVGSACAHGLAPKTKDTATSKPIRCPLSVPPQSSQKKRRRRTSSAGKSGPIPMMSTPRVRSAIS
jgi:hypothetical protein